MGILYTLGLLLSVFACTVSTEESKHTYAVSSFCNLEDYYTELKRLQPSLSYSKQDDLHVKESICAAIFASPYFSHVHKVHHVQTNSGETGEKELESDKLSTNIKKYELQEITVHGDVFHELVFSCTLWNRTSRTTAECFVSREYYCTQHAKARFVFSQNEKKETVVIAVAEEPAKISKNSSVDNYLHYKGNIITLRKFGRSRAICDLSSSQRSRLCSMVLGAEKYRNDFRFLPNETNVPSCEPRELLLRYKKYVDVWEDTIIEWAIECEVSKIIEPQEPEFFYISLSPESDQFFISQKVENKNVILTQCHAPHLGLS